MWKDEQVINLFTFIENGKKQGKTLSVLFAEFAKLDGRKPNSVRNYYYNELCELEQNKARREALKIDLSLHQKCEQKAFDEVETKRIVSEILRLKSLGYSVRKACYKLSDGNLELMVRYQNKFRVLMQKDKQLVSGCKQELKNKGFVVEENPNCKVIKMPQRGKALLSDSDINSLFLGLVKLVKSKAMEEAEGKLKREAEFANDTLRKSLVEIQCKDMEIKKLRSQIKLVQGEKEKIKQELYLLRGQNANLLKKQLKNSEKIQKLRDFAKNFEKNKINSLENN